MVAATRGRAPVDLSSFRAVAGQVTTAYQMANFSCIVCVVRQGRQGQGFGDTPRDALSGPMVPCYVMWF